jgi:hypothetical protein
MNSNINECKEHYQQEIDVSKPLLWKMKRKSLKSCTEGDYYLGKSQEKARMYVLERNAIYCSEKNV